MKKIEGKILAKWLEEKNMSVSEMAERTGITRQGVYYHLRKEEIDSSFKDKLANAGFDIPELGVKSFDKKRYSRPQIPISVPSTWPKSPLCTFRLSINMPMRAT